MGQKFKYFYLEFWHNPLSLMRTHRKFETPFSPNSIFQSYFYIFKNLLINIFQTIFFELFFKPSRFCKDQQKNSTYVL